MDIRDRIVRFFHERNVMAPFSRFYRAMVLKMNQHEDEATTSGLTDGAPLEQNRIIFINRPQPIKFINNRISTAKYSVPSFIPLFLFEQFRRYSNCFFLLIALLQQIPDVSPTGRWTTLTPLILILSVSAIKEIVEDFKRHRADDETNRRSVDILREGRWSTISWEQLLVGDVCKVVNNQFFPADIVMLASSEPQGISFIETSNLDGETNLKIRMAHPDTARLDNTQALADFTATLQSPLKRSSIDRQTNTHILMLFLILLTLSLLSAGFNELWMRAHSDWYIGLEEAQNANFGFNFLTFLILYNNLIPISLQVTAEIVRFFQAKFIAMDVEMYHVATDTPAMARTSNLNEELGMVKYVFSDKTGTLTCNVMEFRKCTIGEIIYSAPGPNEKLEDTLLYQNLQRNHPTAGVIREFLTMLAVCHTVIPERVGDQLNYHAASPDERALVLGAAALGYEFDQRTPRAVRVRAAGRSEEFAVLNVLDFTSARKRMSVIVRTPSGEIKLYCKGADSVIYPRLAGGAHAQYADTTLSHLELFACDGLRTLVFAVADISEQFYQDWANTYHKASIAIQDREQKIEEAAMLIENNLRLLGATAIEDKLQVCTGLCFYKFELM
ncbi:hypothetical protein B5X24_HaOG216873 [Helicoverpa armigera]|uniref:P-type ATPase N-terminal domain-containing protein n=1 Tax=Helicoverpa armigera TaxID=29058 RepID=A0A2W1BVH4_HELAM|nr:hypothetical protein B5X24_HaOG216873 [Helicoverpa armigera]